METDDPHTYDVVMNDEEQYSIWPTEKTLPAGWVKTGFSGRKAACLEHIDEVWTDMRPLSVRRHLEQQQRTEAAGKVDAER